jgi:hypothetical protein
MSQKRVSLGERRLQDRRGIDVLIPNAASEDDVPAAGKHAERPAKVTLYVRPDQVTGLEEIQLAERRRTGKKPDKSDLVQEALDLLIQKYSKTP